jgi:hypothetical protein
LDEFSGKSVRHWTSFLEKVSVIGRVFWKKCPSLDEFSPKSVRHWTIVPFVGLEKSVIGRVREKKSVIERYCPLRVVALEFIRRADAIVT